MMAKFADPEDSQRTRSDRRISSSRAPRDEKRRGAELARAYRLDLAHVYGERTGGST